MLWEGVNDTFDFTVSGGEVTITAVHTDLTDIVVPASINGNPVVSVKEDVFANNSSITSVVFDGTFENYTEKMFAGCSSLKSLTISGVFDKALWWLFGDSASSVPASFTEISFALNSNYIDGYMFKGREQEWGDDFRLSEHSITYIIPVGVTKINNQQFQGWTGLQSVVIPSSVKNIGQYAFSGCMYLTNAVIPSGVISIEERAFQGCSSLKSVTIPNSVTNIESEAFVECRELTNVIIPDSVVKIGERAFDGCNENLYTKSGGVIYVDNWAVDVVNDLINSVIVKPGTRAIADRVFCYCNNLMSVTIPDGVTGIGECAIHSERDFQKTQQKISNNKENSLQMIA